MSISADQSRLTARVGGADYAVVSVCGQEAFNHPFSFVLELVVPGFPALTNQLGSSVSLSMLATSGQQRTLYGLVTEVAHVMGLPDGQQLWRLEVSSHLYRLQQATDTRLLLDHSLPEIIQLLCRRHGLDDNALFCDFSHSYPARPTTLQAGESDFDFLARLCSRNGILFWSAASDEQEVLHFADTASHCRPLVRPALEYRASASLEHDANDNDLLTMKLGAQLVSDRYMVHDVAESAPGQELLSARELPGAGKSTYGTTEVRFGRGVTSADAASEATQRLAHIGTSQQLNLTITSHAVDLRVGRIVRIEADRFGSDVSGDYLITAMTHRLKQYAGLGLGGEKDCPYTNTVTLVPRETPYRVAETKLPTVPLTITARIESKDQTAQLDSAGRTRYHQHNDSAQKPFGQNSIFTRRLQPYGGTGNGHQPGFHMPLQDGAEILVSCLNNDPDRLVIVGSLPNPENHSPVTASNAAQNRLRTMNDQELLLDDTIDAPVISLRTFAGHNILHLNASKAEHLLRLATEQGLAEFYAKQTIATTSGDTLTETVGNNRIQVVEDKHETITNSAEIHHQSATDVLLRGANNIDLESGKNTEFEVGNDMLLDIREAMNITVGGSSAAININSGSMILDADGAINIQGDGGGDISIGQAGGGIKIDPAGNVTLFGTNVNFAGAVSLSGKVNMAITSPPSVSLASGVGATAAIGITQLHDYAEEHGLETNFACTQLQGVARLMAERPFILWLANLFGYDIPVAAYAQFRTDLLSGSLPQPEYVVIRSGGSNLLAAYNSKDQQILVGLKMIEEARQNNDASWKLNIALSEEFGHHVDNLLRNHYSTVGGDAYMDEGARYAYNILNYKVDLQSITSYAIHTGDGGNIPLTVEYAGATAAIKRYLAVENRYDFDVKDGYEHFVCARSAGDRGPGLSFGHESIEDALEVARFNDVEREQIFFGNWTRDYNQLVCPQLLKAPGEVPGLGMCEEPPAGTSADSDWPVLLNYDLGIFVQEFKGRLADGFLSRGALTAIINALAEAKFIDPDNHDISIAKQRQIFAVTEERLGVYRPEEHIDNPAGLSPSCKDSALRGPVLPSDLEIDPKTGMKRFIASKGCRSSYDFIENYFAEAIRLQRTPDGLRYFGMGLHVLEDFFCHTNFVEICLFKLGHQDVILWAEPDPVERVPMTSGVFGFIDTVVSILFEISHHMVQAADCQQPWERTTGQKIMLIFMREKNLAWGKRLDALWTMMEDFKEDHPEYFQNICEAREFLFGWASKAMGKVVEKISGLIDDMQTFADSEGIAEPTHSQMSKDHDVHPLHVLAATLAKIAVENVGKAMMAAYEENGSLEQVMAEVRKIMTHPQDTQWMDTEVKQWAEANPENVVRAADRRWLGEQAQKRYQQLQDDAQKMMDEARKQADLLESNDAWLKNQFKQVEQQAEEYSGQLQQYYDNFDLEAEKLRLKNEVTQLEAVIQEEATAVTIQVKDNLYQEYQNLGSYFDQAYAQVKEQYSTLMDEVKGLSKEAQEQYDNLIPHAQQLSDQGVQRYNELTEQIPQLQDKIKQKYRMLEPRFKQFPDLAEKQFGLLMNKIEVENSKMIAWCDATLAKYNPDDDKEIDLLQILGDELDPYIAQGKDLAKHGADRIVRIGQQGEAQCKGLAKTVEQLKTQGTETFKALIKEIKELQTKITEQYQKLKADTVHDSKIVKDEAVKMKGIMLEELRGLQEMIKKSKISDDEASTYYEDLLEYYQGGTSNK